MDKAFDYSRYENWIDPAEAIPYERNAKKHDERQIANIAASIKKIRMEARVGVELSRTREQVDFWLDKAKNPKGKLTVDQAHRALMDSGVLDTPHLRFDFKTGAIKEWDNQ